MKKKNGIENSKFDKERIKENSRAPKLKRTFFCNTAAKAERNAELNAIRNQSIKSLVSYNN